MSPVQGESPLVQVKELYGNLKWLLVGFHPATRSVQSTPADNTRKRIWPYIEKERYIKIIYLKHPDINSWNFLCHKYKTRKPKLFIFIENEELWFSGFIFVK